MTADLTGLARYDQMRRQVIVTGFPSLIELHDAFEALKRAKLDGEIPAEKRPELLKSLRECIAAIESAKVVER